MTTLSLSPIAGGYVAVESPYDEAIVAQFKAVPGCRWDRHRHVWVGPAEAVAIVCGELERAGHAIDDRFDALHLIGDGNPEPPEASIGLRDYQRYGIDFLVGRCRTLGAALLADDPGLGKSAQAICALAPERSVLVVAPAVVLPHWEEQIKRWHPAADRTDVIQLTTPKRIEMWNAVGGWGLISWDAMRTRAHLLSGAPGSPPATPAAVLDEIHYAMTSKSARTKAVRDYLARCDKRPCAVGLSGTPMTARVRDLYSPLDLLFPGRFGTFVQFTTRYCDGHHEEIPGVPNPVWVSDGRSNGTELARRLKPLMLRREKRDCLSELSPVQRIAVPVELPSGVLREMANASKWESPDTDWGVAGKLSLCEEHKSKAAVELATDLTQQGRRVLLYTTRIKTAEILGAKLGCPVVTGEVASASKRRELLTGTNLAVTTMYCVNTGIDLTQFDAAIFVGLDWVPSTLLQAEARLHRLGQRSDVLIYYLIALRTLDEVVRAKVIDRLDMFGTIIGGGAEGSALADALQGNEHDDLLSAIIAAGKAMAKR